MHYKHDDLNKDVGKTREFPAVNPESDSSDLSQTRQIPTQKTPRDTADPTATRKVPRSRQTLSDDLNATRTVPAPTTEPAVRPTPRPAVKSDDLNATRTVPAPKSEPAVRPTPRPAVKSDDLNVTRTVPAPKSEPAARPTPRPAVKSDDLNATRKISSSDDMNMTKPMSRTSSKPEELGGTKEVPIPAAAPSDTVNDPSDSPEPEDKGKKKKKKSFTDDPSEDEGTALVSVIKAVVYIVAVLVISVSASIFIILVANDMYAFVKSEDTVEITIPEGADIDDIATILADNNVIKYPSIFKWKADGDDGKFIPGTYTVAMNLDYDDLLAAFKEQRNEGTSWVTIPEGFTTDEIINLLVETGIGTKEGYIEVINNYPFDYWFVKEIDKTDWKSTGRFYRLDGYLFPDTYEFYNESTERAVINKLLARFNVIFTKKYREAADSMGMSIDQVITVASMVEKEAGKAADYHLISSVFHNRLASDYYPKLESDATALYAIHHDTGERPTDVTGEHMKYDSPYNTYLYDGLPPGPIANPSASSINAALTPETSGYYFFVSYGLDTYFSSSWEEHQSNLAMIEALKNRSEAPAEN